MPSSHDGSPRAGRFLALLAAYAAAYALGRFLGNRGPGTTVLWPAAGLLVAATLAAPRGGRSVLLSAVGALHVSLAVLWGQPFFTGAGLAVAHITVALAAAALHERWIAPDGRLPDLKAIFRFALAVAPLACASGAAVAGLAFALTTSPDLRPVTPGHFAATWFVATLTGTLIVAPVLLTRIPGPASPASRPTIPTRGKTTARVVLVVGLVAVTIAAFGQPWLVGREVPYLRFAPLPLLVWSAFRLGPADTAAASLFVCFGATGFHRMNPAIGVGDLVWLQAYLVSANVTALALSVACAERRDVEARLAERTDFLGRVVEAARIGVWDADVAEGRIRVDAGFRAMLRYPDEVTELSLDEAFRLVHPEEEGAARAHWDSFLRHGAPSLDVVTRLRQGDGTWRPVLVRGSGQRDAAGRIVRAVGTVTDVTELRDAVETARVAEARFRAAAEGGLDAFCLLSSVRGGGGAVEDFTVTYLNRNGAWMFGRRVEEVVGRRVGDVVPEFRTNGFLRRLARAATSGRVFSEEMRLDTPGIRAAQVHVQVVATPDGVAVLLRDVTERRRLERDLRQAQKMEGLGRLAGGVAHDFNNLLTVMRGYCEMARTQVSPGSSVAACLDQVMTAADRASDLTGRLLTFSRREKVEMRRVDARSVVFDVEKLVRRLVGDDVRVEVDARADAAWTVVEPGGLEQAILNLAANARDAMPRGGLLTISVRTAHLSEEEAARHIDGRPGEFVVLAISDTGTGMPPEVLSRLFEPFFTTKPPGEGTGLGLAICYGVVKQAAGFICVESEAGRGTRFALHLPLADPPTGEVAPVPADTGGTAAPAKRRETVLVVDDEPAVRRILVEGLRTAGYRVLEASDGNAALAASRQHEGPIDLLVSDVRMPGFRGPEVAALLRAERPGTRVLLVSGHAAEALDFFPGAGPPPPLLTKPFTIAALHAKVRELLDAVAA